MNDLQTQWQSAQEPINTPFFTALRSTFSQLSDKSWPSLPELNELAKGIKTLRGTPIEFVAPTSDEQYYEKRIAENGLIATRENWHDLFNAFTWITFPKAKASISEMHVRLLDVDSRQRNIERDVLTLFDESGIVVLSEDASLLELIAQFEWKRLFWGHRTEVEKSMRFYVFGHGVMEKCLNPYIGMIAKSVCFTVPDGFLSQSVDEQIAYCDTQLARHFMNTENLQSTRALTPIPILGIPDWDARNASESFHDNTQYFRSGYSR